MKAAALAVLGGVWLAGCATDPEPIHFADDSAIHGLAAAAAPAALAGQNPLAKADEQGIELAVFSWLLDRHFWDQAGYSAVFVQAEDAQVEILMKKFPRHQPPVKMSYHANVRLNQTPLDKDTGRPAMILSAEMNEPNADGSVDAVGHWFAGGAVSGFYVFTLQKSAGEWRVIKAQ